MIKKLLLVFAILILIAGCPVATVPPEPDQAQDATQDATQDASTNNQDASQDQGDEHDQ
ncbi:MAG: hypothetical protein ACR2MS_07730 [Weeksellaceae bacterium]